jgi:hypothetical protein
VSVAVRGRKRIEDAFIFRPHKRDLELAAVIIVKCKLAWREENVGVVGSKHIATKEYLNAFGVGFVLIDYGEDNSDGWKLGFRATRPWWSWDADSLGEINRESDLPDTIITCRHLFLEPELLNEMYI